jgi:hypothetical protein
MLTVDKLARVKRVLDDLDMRDIPVSDDPEKLANAFILGSLHNEETFNEFFAVLTGKKDNYYVKPYTEVVGIAIDFFTNTESQLKELIVTMLGDKKVHYDMEVESVRNLQIRAMTEAMKAQKETTTSKSVQD